MKKQIYLDNAATTRTRREVAAVLRKYLVKEYGNPSSIHRSGFIARGTIELARERIATILGCASEELIFTGSASESNNLAIRGGAAANRQNRCHIITSAVEHSSCFRTCQALEKEGYRVTYLGVDHEGYFDLTALEEALTPETSLVSLGWVNSEVGTIQDIAAIVEIVKRHGVLLHIDAVQALPHLPVELDQIGADMVSFAGHKLHSPKGVGLLYIRQGTQVISIIDGGSQEFGLRSGTENVPYIAGLARAIELNHTEKNRQNKRLTRLRDQIIVHIQETIPDVLLTGPSNNRLSNHVSFCFADINGKMLVKELSYKGIEVSSGAACSSPRNEPSHVLVACGVEEPYLMGGLRITLGRYNTQRDINFLLKILPRVVADMRTRQRPYRNKNIFISQKAFQQRLAIKEPLQLIDVRPVKYPPRLIPGSIHIPSRKLKRHLKKLNPDTETILVCFHGDIISPEGQMLLTQHGFADVKVLKGGFFGYENANH